MREIRFRAWRTDEKYMVTSDRGVLTALRHCYGNKGLAEQAGFSNIDNQPNPDRFILMQYTGLKDKNGKEIYEGDILKLWRSVGKNGELRAEYYKPLVVEYCDTWCQFVVEDKEQKQQYGIWQQFQSFEVIGNIYENPELLKGA